MPGSRTCAVGFALAVRKMSVSDLGRGACMLQAQAVILEAELEVEILEVSPETKSTRRRVAEIHEVLFPTMPAPEVAPRQPQHQVRGALSVDVATTRHSPGIKAHVVEAALSSNLYLGHTIETAFAHSCELQWRVAAATW